MDLVHHHVVRAAQGKGRGSAPAGLAWWGGSSRHVCGGESSGRVDCPLRARCGAAVGAGVADGLQITGEGVAGMREWARVIGNGRLLPLLVAIAEDDVYLNI